MAASQDDFLEGFSMEVTAKPVSGVTDVVLPKALTDVLEVAAPKALADKDNSEIRLTAKDAASAQRIALYAKAWGKQQTPQLRITKVQNIKGMSDNVARLSVQLESDVPPENRPGRRSK